MITTRLQDLEAKITVLSNVTGFKKSITEYNKVAKEISAFKDYIDRTEQSFRDETAASTADEDISDTQFEEYMDQIKKIGEQFDDLDIDEQIQIYPKLLRQIGLCERYLAGRKLEIVYL